MSATIRTDLTNAEYHASEGLSASGAKMLLPPSCPALYKHERDNPVHKDVYDFGSAAHKLVLGDDQETIVEVDADSWRTKGAREQRDAACESGAIPMLSKDYAVVRAMAERLHEHPIASKLLRPGSGTVEPSIFWTDGRTGVQRRCRLDWLPETSSGRLILPEYKTARSAEPTAFGKALWDYGYAMQAAWNSEAVRAAELADEVAFVFVVQMKDPPYLVTVVQPDEPTMRIGDERNRRAIDIYAHCTETEVWPGFSDDVEVVSLPGWATYQHEDHMESA